MKRLLYQSLMDWKKAPHRKPLLLQGARQVGKTYLLKQFAEQAYSDFVYCNFEEDTSLASLFEKKLSPYLILDNLGFYRGKKVTPETLIIFDEVQLAPRALTSLKYFCEEAKEYSIVAAGSLLGVSVGQTSSFPVGKVNFLDLYPLNFVEYLQAIDESMLAELLLAKRDVRPLETPLHEKLTQHFRAFLYLGGMPEVVSVYANERNIEHAERIKNDIHLSYSNDFSKYAHPSESIKISQLWQSIPFQLAKENKKFKFSDVEKGGRLSKYELALEWLRKAGLIHIAYQVSKPELPIKAYSEHNKFKIYYLDTGLLTPRLKASTQLLVENDKLYTEYRGALIENYVAKEIKPQFDEYLYYWTSQNVAEVDFIVEMNSDVIPMEVKSGLSKQKKSLVSFKDRYQPKILVRFSPRNFRRDDCFINLPLYAAGISKKLLEAVF